ncbi:MAG: hypothetical protein ACFE7I_09835 [Candidatus Hodarchaeota archaeon]
MSEEKKRIRTISDQFNEEITKLAVKTEKEIQQMVDDAVSAFKTIYKRKPDLLHSLMFYDDLILRLTSNLLAMRDVKKQKMLSAQE